MVVAGSPNRTHSIDCSVARGAGAIAAGPFPVLLPPDGPSDPSSQLRQDAATLRRQRMTDAAQGRELEWLGIPIDALAARSSAIARQLAPVRTRETLLESYRREAGQSPEIRLAYAMVWLALGQSGADAMVGRRRSRRTAAGRPR